MRSSLNDYKSLKSQPLKSCETRIKMRPDFKTENLSLKLPSLVTYRKPLTTNANHPLLPSPPTEKTHSNYSLTKPSNPRRLPKNPLLQTDSNNKTDQELQVDLL
jgi:hypothetical protein